MIHFAAFVTAIVAGGIAAMSGFGIAACFRRSSPSLVFAALSGLMGLVYAHGAVHLSSSRHEPLANHLSAIVWSGRLFGGGGRDRTVDLGVMNPTL